MGLTWGIIAIIMVMFSLAASIIIGLAVHSRKIKESEVKFRTLFRNVFDALFLIDSRGKIIDVNNSACALSRYSKKDLLNMRIGRMLPSGLSVVLRGKRAKMKLGELVYFGETILRNKDNDSIHVEVGGIRIMIGEEEFTLASFRDIHARKLAEIELEKKNIALREILSHIEEEKRNYKHEIGRMVENSLLPTLKKLVKDDGDTNTPYYEYLEENLQNLAFSAGSDLKSFSRLSPRELEVCNLIKGGASSKDIAATLNISIITVNKHRERIRKKLLISNKDINLSTFLKKL